MSTTAARVAIDVESVPQLSYAMAHNAVPFIDRLRLHREGPAVGGAELTIEVRDAHGPLSRPWTRLVDLPDGGDVVLEDLAATLDPAAMLQVEEQRPALVVVTLTAGGRELGRREVGVHLLAAHQWLSRPVELGLEMLAAFVQPNHPAVAELLAEASDVLRERTGSGAVTGYQSGSERADEIAEAVWIAMAARRIRYSEPPASWSDVGQKVRTPGQVLTDRVGTCLDTTVVMAAALEQAGLHPLLWITAGHAFVGYWRREVNLAATVSTDVAALANRVDLGLIQLVETTMVTDREEPVPFSATHRSPYRDHLTGNVSDVIGVVDVVTARQSRILPLPATTRSAAGAVQVVEYRPAEHSAPPPPERPARPRPAGTAAVPPRVQQWKSALLDLTLNNRLINLSARQAVHLVVPDGRLGALADIVTGGSPLTLLADDAFDEVHRARGTASAADLPAAHLEATLLRHHGVHTDLPSAACATRLAALAHRARTITEETGANNLHLALGTLVWDVDGRVVRSPLVLVPVTLVRGRGSSFGVVVDESGAPTPNHCLLEKLRQVHDLEVPGLAELDADGAGTDLDAALDAVRTAVAEAGLSARVEASADLGVLAFAKFRLWKDLDEHWEEFAANPLVQHLVATPNDPFEDPSAGSGEVADLDELAAACPVAADASQLAAVADAVAGRTFVLEGPPGTGKSQTITNLLVRALAQGQRVLFVAEKRAALDVVRDRLDAVGMGPLCLDLHDRGSRPNAVRAQVRSALEHDADVDEQGMAVALGDLASSRRALARYAARLHEPGGAGLSLYSARTSVLALGEGPAFEVPGRLLGPAGASALPPLRAALEALADVADLAGPCPHHPWGLVGLREGLAPDAAKVRAGALEVDRALGDPALAEASGPLARALAAVAHPGQLWVLAELAGAPDVTLDVLDAVRTPAWRAAGAGLLAAVERFVASSAQSTSSASSPGRPPCFEVVAPTALDLPLAQLHERALAARASGFFGRTKRLRAVAAELEPFLRPGAAVAPQDVPELTGALARVRQGVDDLLARAGEVTGVHLAPGWNPLLPQEADEPGAQVRWLAWVGAVLDPGDDAGRALRAVVASPALAAAAPALREAAAAFEHLADVAAADEDACARWSGAAGLLARWRQGAAGRDLADERALGLRRHSALLLALEPLRAAGLDAARAQLLDGRVDAGDAVRALDRGVALASLRERSTSTGLDAFDAAAHERAITRFTASAAAVRAHVRTAVPHQVREGRPFDPASGRGRVGELVRQLNRARGGLGVRALMSTYGDLITASMPCVLVSPDSLARFFPPRAGLFDLVVFDEASQIRVADAVGAMGRARSVVVVGDSQQMPPTAFGQAGPTDEEELADDLAVADQESILSECVLARVPRRWLSWHYRSQDESLIAFSNRHYYEDRLSSFPSPPGPRAPGDGARGISLVRVDGAFVRTGAGPRLRTNPREAQAVVEEVARRFAASPERTPSLGIITFNAPQRALVEALLVQLGDERVTAALATGAGEGLFVKNLENVQGDERDVILFSTAFSADEKGVLPLNFGPLNRSGGERRLNVAVTRARRQVVVFTSFDPEQLRAQETSSVGVKHLRAYLDLAAGGAHDPGRGRRRAGAVDRHREEVADALRRRGLVVTTGVGLSDFTVDLTLALAREPERAVVAVLLDGPAWARRRTVGDRDGLPVEVLRDLVGWPAVERVWLPEWLAAPAQVAERLERVALAAAAPVVPAPGDPAPAPAAPAAGAWSAADDELLSAAAPHAPLRRATGARAPERATGPAAHGRPGGLLGERPFQAWSPGVRGPRSVLDELPAAAAAARVRAVLAEAVAAEGPVHRERLARLVAGAFGLSRVSASRAAAVLDVLPRTAGGRAGEPFVWPPGVDPQAWTGFRRSGADAARPLEHVSRREIGNAMVALCSSSGGMFYEELLREALVVFGGRRMTVALSARLEEALVRASSEGRLRRGADGVWSAD